MKLGLRPDSESKVVHIVGEISQDEIDGYTLGEHRPDLVAKIQAEVVKQVAQMYVERYAATLIGSINQEALATLCLANIASEVAKLVGHKK